MPKNKLETTVVTILNLTPKPNPNNMTEIIMIEVTGLILGNACRYIREAILTAANIPIKLISFTLLE